MILWPFVFFRVCYLTCVYPPSPSPAEVSGVDGALGKRRLFYSPVCFGMFILGEHKPLLIRSFSNIRYWLCSSDPRPASQLYGKSDAGLNIGYALFISDIFTFFVSKGNIVFFGTKRANNVRMVCLILLCIARGGTYIVEQPGSSVLREYHRFDWLCETTREPWQQF